MKEILALTTLALAGLQLLAAPVDVTVAQSQAQQFMLSHHDNTGRLMASQAGDVKLVHQEVCTNGLAAYYVFNTDNGFVIIAGDDRSRQLLAWGNQPFDLVNLPPNAAYLLNTYKKQMEYLHANPSLTVENPMLKAAQRAGKTVSPLLKTTWSQNSPYFNHCPTSGGYTMTGCCATSLAMVFHYWKYPTGPTPTVPSYTTTTLGLTLDELPSITFDWANMLNSYSSSYTTAQADAVAWLMRYLGQAMRMDYDTSGSGAEMEDMVDACHLFGYEDAYLVFKSNFDDNANEIELINDNDWATMIQEELEAGRPICYGAYEYTWTGHAFNVDGYDATTDTYHVNFGWGGTDNNYYALNAFEGAGYVFDAVQQMIIGIEPPPTTPTIKVLPGQVSMMGYVNKPVTNTLTVKGKLLTGNITLTLDDPNGAYSLDATTISAADAAAGKAITVTFTPTAATSQNATITLRSTGADDVTVKLFGVGQYETYAPVMLPVNDNYVNLTQFRADWTDQTPDYNVTSYTLEVNNQPSTRLIAEADFSGLPQGNNVASNYSQYLPTGWTFTGDNLWLDGGCLSMNKYGVITTCPLDLTGYDKVTVVVRAKNDTQYTNTTTLTVQTTVDVQIDTLTGDYVDYTHVLHCNQSDDIDLVVGYYYADIQSIKIYVDGVDASLLKAASEQGGANYRLVSGINGKNYTVKDLTAGGTFYYRVRAMYNNGTGGVWSNYQKVTLHQNDNPGQDTLRGDVNLDGKVDVTDVNILISIMMGTDSAANYDGRAYITEGDTVVDVSDINVLIGIMLGL